jgi:putative endonuclease
MKQGLDIGAIGEQTAALYLARKGLRIKERNFRCRLGEIDIIALDGSCLVFVEVKTRRSCAYGRPSEFVNAKKQEKLIKAAGIYTHGENVEMRFDVVEVIYELHCGEVLICEIEHIENAFTE